MPRSALILVAACAHAGGDTADVERVLRRQTQELLDAVTNGDPTVWDRYLDARTSYLSEAGELNTKAAIVAQVAPLPKGISGKLALDRFTVQRFGDTAVAVYVAKESEDYFGTALTAEYMTTDTWRRTGAGWRLIGTQVHAVLADPPAIELPPAQLDEYAGAYRMTGDQRYEIRRDGAALVGERAGRPPSPLRVEVRDVLFVPGQPRSRKVFQRDAAGAVTGFVDRREGRDIPWTRVTPAAPPATTPRR